jgi:hypothetical protein
MNKMEDGIWRREIWMRLHDHSKLPWKLTRHDGRPGCTWDRFSFSEIRPRLLRTYFEVQIKPPKCAESALRLSLNLSTAYWIGTTTQHRGLRNFALLILITKRLRKRRALSPA